MKRNIHSTHIEDFCLTGKEGTLQALSSLVFVKNNFGAFTDKPVVTVKYDGYAIIAGWIGECFFVSSKSLFNKDPKINFTDEDIDKNHSGGLGKRLHLALKYLKPIIPFGKIYQGDYLFDSELLKQSGNHFSFQPNTIQYSTEKLLQITKLGIIFHTEYEIYNNDIKTIQIKSFGPKRTEFNKTSDVWFTDAICDLSRIQPLSKGELIYFDSMIDSIKSAIINVNWTTDHIIIKNLVAFVNSYIRDSRIVDPEIKAVEFGNWISAKMETKIQNKKTKKGKNAEQQKWNSSLEYAKNINSLANLFAIHTRLTKLKLLILKKLNTIKIFDTNIVKNDNTLVQTENEGFVLASGPIPGSKLVNRYVFSLANFSQDYKKGWFHD